MDDAVTENASRNAPRRFYAWWLDELSKVLTPRRSGALTWRVLLRDTSEGLEINTRAAGASGHLGTLKVGASPDQIAALRARVLQEVGAKPKQVLLRLSSSDVVERTIQIPQAASDVIDAILQNQMERIVPWSQDDTRYGYRVVGASAASPDQLDVHVVATTKSILDGALRRAHSVGLTPQAIDFAQAPEGIPIELMSLEPDPVKRTARVLHTVLVVILATSVAVGGLGFYSMWVRQGQSDELETTIATARSRVAVVNQLNAKNSQLRQQRERLVRRKKEDPAVVVLIEALSRALPDSAYLTELEIHGRETRIVGKSDDPTALVTKLEGTTLFKDVQFSAPTTREIGETTGTFSIVGRAQGGPHLGRQP